MAKIKIDISSSSTPLAKMCQDGHDYFREVFNNPNEPWYSGSNEVCELDTETIYTYSGSFMEHGIIEWATQNYPVTCSFYNTEIKESILLYKSELD